MHERGPALQVSMPGDPLEAAPDPDLVHLIDVTPSLRRGLKRRLGRAVIALGERIAGEPRTATHPGLSARRMPTG